MCFSRRAIDVFKAMPNGFRHELMLRRLALRVDESDGQLRARVALRQAMMSKRIWSQKELVLI